MNYIIRRKPAFFPRINFIFLLLASSFPLFAQIEPAPQSGFRDSHPEDHLPPYIRRVNGFGERPDWSHDGKKILFVEKPMGEVYELDLATGLLHPKTRHFNHYGFTRALYLPNGDILLAGPVEPFDPTDPEERNRARDMSWLFVLDKSGTGKPFPLNAVCAEGPAVSRSKLRIAWTERDRQIPDLGKNHARNLMADIVYEDGVPRLANRRVVFDSHQLPFPLGDASLETQNWIPPEDTKLIFCVYQIEDGNNTDTYVVDTETGEFQNLTQSPGYYDEPEGVFPDGQHTCVEHGPSKHTAWPLLDLFKLKLDGSGEMQRLTYFSDFKGFKATQGVVSDDGRYLCFQIGKSGDEAGVGYGFFIMDLKAAAEHLEPFQNFSEGIHPLQQVTNRFVEAWKAGQPLPAISNLMAEVTLDQAYNIQRAWLFATLEAAGIGGVKGAAVTPAGQQRLNIREPLAGILRAAGRIDASGNEEIVIRRKEYPELVLETELGFVIGRKIDKRLETVKEFKAHVKSLAPVIELPAGAWAQPEGRPLAIDYAAVNVRSAGYIVGEPVPANGSDLREVPFEFSKNGETLHRATGAECWKGPWETGLRLAQFAHRQGIILEPGQLIICGALGEIHPGAKGDYLLDAGTMGKIRFTVR